MSFEFNITLLQIGLSSPLLLSDQILIEMTPKVLATMAAVIDDGAFDSADLDSIARIFWFTARMSRLFEVPEFAHAVSERFSSSSDKRRKLWFAVLIALDDEIDLDVDSVMLKSSDSDLLIVWAASKIWCVTSAPNETIKSEATDLISSQISEFLQTLSPSAQEPILGAVEEARIALGADMSIYRHIPQVTTHADERH